MEDDSLESKRIFHIASIVLLGVGSYFCLLALVLLRNVCKLHSTRQFTPEQLISNKALLPKYIKVVGKVVLTNPLTSRIGRHPNCLRYRSRLIYHYDTLEQVWEPRRDTFDANGRVNGQAGGYYRNEVKSNSQVLLNEKLIVDQFDLVGEDGSSRISVGTGEPISVNVKYDGKLKHTEKRGRRDSSLTDLTCPHNPNVHERMGSLPLPHSRSSIEIDEKWIEFGEDDDRLVSVYGVASILDGIVIMAAGGLNNRMIIEDGTSKWVWCCIMVWVLTLLTLSTGIFFFLNPETFELPWFPNETEE
jgi:hypothetical protein